MDRISDDTLNELFTQNNQKDVNRIDDIINSISTLKRLINYII